MSETTETPPTTETEASADKRERRTFPIRLMAQEPGGAWSFVKDVEAFGTIADAEKWISASGTPGVAYLMPRITGCKRRPPTKLEDVVI